METGTISVATKPTTTQIALPERKNECKNVIDEGLINEISKQYLCIGGKWYKKSIDPITGQEELYPVNPSVMIDGEGHLYPKEIVERVRNAAPQYLARTNLPSHINYSECIVNGIGDRFYNDYRPINHIPKEGTWIHIEQVIKHIFQEHYEMGLDYFQLLYVNPLQPLPVLVLVSRETGTGKSTFCKLVQAIFGANALPLTTDIFESRFNAYWTGKLVVYLEEQESDSKEERKQSAKRKNAVTADTLPSEGKGKDPKVVNNFVKVIICSNNELTPVKIDSEDSRYWVRKIPPLDKGDESIDILAECKKEIPAFLHYLLNREMFKKRENRLWFRPEDFRTEAWKRIVVATKSELEQGLIDMFLEIMTIKRINMIRYSATELYDVICSSDCFSKKEKNNVSKPAIREILTRWGLRASRTNDRHPVYHLIGDGKVDERSCSSKVFRITKELLKRI